MGFLGVKNTLFYKKTVQNYFSTQDSHRFYVSYCEVNGKHKFGREQNMEIITAQLQSQVLLQNCQSLNSSIVSYLKKLVSCFGRAVALCLECSIWLHIGGFAGWLLGRSIALIYRHCCEPMHFVSFDVTNGWYYLPHEYGKFGMIAGAILGIVILLMVTLIKSAKTKIIGKIKTTGRRT